MGSTTKSKIKAFIIGTSLLYVTGFAGVVRGADEPDDMPHTVVLFHPSTVGQTYQLHVTAKQQVHNIISVAGQQPNAQNNDIAANLDGVVKVLAVDSKGAPTQLQCTIQKFTETVVSQTRDMLPVGVIVVADAGASGGAGKISRTKFSMKGGILSGEQQMALDLVLVPHQPQSFTDQDIFGTDMPQKVGASWAIDSVKAAKDAERSGITLRPEDVSGRATLVGVTRVGDTTYLQIKAMVQAKSVQTSVPPGMTIDRSMMIGEFAALLPEKGSSQRRADTIDLSIAMTVKGPAADGRPATIQTTSRLHRELETTPVQPE